MAQIVVLHVKYALGGSGRIGYNAENNVQMNAQPGIEHSAAVEEIFIREPTALRNPIREGVHTTKSERPPKRAKKNGLPSRVAVVGLGNIETVHEPKPIQAAGALCMDRVAVLWSDPTAHRPREVKGPMPSSAALGEFQTAVRSVLTSSCYWMVSAYSTSGFSDSMRPLISGLGNLHCQAGDSYNLESLPDTPY
ncbi:hypothetical protein C8R43DRAFT_957739 [Mycena crocata]|nr:hypothetical protein C8R43DRAFT_957739 [Mycena crocata]